MVNERETETKSYRVRKKERETDRQSDTESVTTLNLNGGHSLRGYTFEVKCHALFLDPFSAVTQRPHCSGGAGR